MWLISSLIALLILIGSEEVLGEKAVPIIEKIKTSYNRIETLQGEIARHFSSGEQREITIGKFYLKKPNKVFIRYAKPEQTLILNDTILWVYLPAQRKAVRKNYNLLSALEKHLIGIESLLGLNPLQGLEQAFKFETLDESTLVAKPKNEGKIVSKIIFNTDPQKNIILATKIFGINGNLTSSTRYENWEEIDGIWFPQQITSDIYAAGKKSREEDIFKHIRINQEIEGEQFNFTVPEGVEVIDE